MKFQGQVKNISAAFQRCCDALCRSTSTATAKTREIFGDWTKTATAVCVVGALAGISLAAASSVSAQVFTSVNHPDAGLAGTYPNKINDSGEIAGTYYDSHVYAHGFIYSAGQWTAIECPDTNGTTAAYGINNNGDVVGSCWSNGHYRGFIFSGGSYNLIGVDTVYFEAINDMGQVVGNRQDGGWGAPFLYDIANDTFTELGTEQPSSSPCKSFTASGINNSGVIAGYGTGSIGGSILYNIHSKTCVSLVYFGGPDDFNPYGYDTHPRGINDNGQ